MHIIRSQQFSRDFIASIFALANTLERERGKPLAGKILASLFYEPSTRTRFSFESAMLRLGGEVLSTENAREFSSAAKGETLEDTIRVVNEYADAIVLRHFEIGAAERAAHVSRVPVINAGDGAGQHPTQALLDLYTIERELGGIRGISVALVGDLKYGRTIRSLAYLLGKYAGVTVFLVSTPELKVERDIIEYLERHEVTFHETADLHSVIPQIDVLYQTRIQKERFPDEKTYQAQKGRFTVTPALVENLKPSAIIMHPLPRVDEIESGVDLSPHAAYFKQIHYGLLIRMALLIHVLTEVDLV